MVPIVLTVYLLYRGFLALDRLLGLPTPGAGAALIVAGIIVVGALASNFVIRKFLQLTDRVFTRAPLVRLLYGAIRDLLEAFVGDRKRFDRPVAVSLTEDVRALGFVTQEDLAFLSLPGQVAVYLPFSYTWDGCMLVVPSSRVQRLDADSATIMALVVSGGVSRM